MIFKKTCTHLIFCVVLLFIFKNSIAQETIIISDHLKIKKISDQSFVHVSYFTSSKGIQYPCNGFIYIINKKAYIFDTPANDLATQALINWLQNDLHVKIKGVIFNHFHVDCLAGMDRFQENKIPCIANEKTWFYMKKEGLPSPDQIFKDQLKLKLDDVEIINTYYGEAHTKDNIISYFPDEELIYGGCMIKSLNAGKGNLSDANVNEWSKTVSLIKKAHPKVNLVIPGHGDYGNHELLDYTISLFKTEN